MLKRCATGVLCLVWVAACAPPPAKDEVISGSLYAEDMTSISPTAVAHIEVADVSDADATPTIVASADVPAPSSPIAFSITVPAAKAPQQGGALSVSARVRDGDQVLFVTAEKNTPAPNTPAQIRLIPVAPVALPYVCGNEKFRIAFTKDEAELTDGDKMMTVLPLSPAQAGAAQGPVRTYAAKKMTIVRDGVNLSFARGDGKPQPCTIGE